MFFYEKSILNGTATKCAMLSRSDMVQGVGKCLEQDQTKTFMRAQSLRGQPPLVARLTGGGWQQVRDPRRILQLSDLFGAPLDREVGARFAVLVHRYMVVEAGLGSSWDEISQRNQQEKDPSICHSHDFCDANFFMAEAIRMETGQSFEEVLEMADPEQRDVWFGVWDAAWARAKAEFFSDIRKAYGVVVEVIPSIERDRPRP